LPPWAQLKRIDPSRPLHDQVADAKVLIPTTGIVDEASIRAAQGLRLIAQPAAGYNNIAVHVARELGIPVTIAPGGLHVSVAVRSH
jgi:lactate dehydrogenase-like 2-hydroxyacid dehydrogenase